MPQSTPWAVALLAITILAGILLWGRRGHDGPMQQNCPPGYYLSINNDCFKRDPAHEALPLSPTTPPIMQYYPEQRR